MTLPHPVRVLPRRVESLRMKNLLLIIVCLLLGILLTACKNREQTNPKQEAPPSGGGPSVTFINEIEEADVWLLPETKENLKTTLWGTPSLKKIAAGEKRPFTLSAPGPSGLYILRVIDKNGMYYSVNGVAFADGYCARLKAGEEPMAAWLEIADKDGQTVKTYSVFAARL